MVSLSILSTAAVLILSGLRPALAFPTDNAALLPRQTVPADTIDKYTVQYFLQQATNKPPPATCLFYTETLSTVARAYADNNEKYTIWGVWPCSFYDRSQDDTNPLRNILKQVGKTNTPDAQTYFENMSEAYAALCSEYAVVMSNTLPNVNEKGIWGRIEKPTLQKTGNVGGQVDKIDACDVKMSNCLDPVYWERPTPKRLARDISGNTNTTEPGKRQTSACPLCASLPNSCYTPEEIGTVFSDIDPLW